jgi:hypothetical protein
MIKNLSWLCVMFGGIKFLHELILTCDRNCILIEPEGFVSFSAIPIFEDVRDSLVAVLFLLLIASVGVILRIGLINPPHRGDQVQELQ